MKNGINVISCFDGMACGMQALKEAGIKVNKYYAFEIDKYAIQVAQKNHPEIIELGDINNWQFFDEIEVPDLILAGSPCQGFSIAGQGLNFDDPRSKLFFTFVELVNYWKKRNPDVKILLENVKMKKEWRDIITEHMEVEPELINSARVSAQNRERYYWANWEFPQPEDKGLALKDVLEDEVDEKLTLSEKELKYMNRTIADGRNHWDFGYIHDDSKDKSQCLVANLHKGVPYNVLIRGAARRNQVTRRGVEAQLNIRKDDKSNFVVPSYTQKLNGIVRIGTALDINGHDILKRIYAPEGKSPTLDSQGGGNREPKVATDSVHYRKLTVRECERLQTLPDDYTLVMEEKKTGKYKGQIRQAVSNSQRYKMIGNGWTVAVIKHILSYLPEEFYTE